MAVVAAVHRGKPKSFPRRRPAVASAYGASASAERLTEPSVSITASSIEQQHQQLQHQPPGATVASAAKYLSSTFCTTSNTSTILLWWVANDTVKEHRARWLIHTTRPGRMR